MGMKTKILLIKLGALGDVLRTTSLLPAIKDKWKDSEVTLVTKQVQDIIQFLENVPGIFKTISSDSDSIAQLEKEKFDFVFNLDEDEEACSIASRMKCGELRGFYFKDGRISYTKSAKEWFDMSALGKKEPRIRGMPHNDHLKKKNRKTYQQLMSEIIGVNPRKCSPIYVLDEGQRAFATSFVKRYDIQTKDLIVGLNTGAGGRWPAKSLSIEKTRKLIEKLHSVLGVKIILFGGKSEAERNKEILTKSGGKVIDAGCDNTLKEFAALTSLCHIFVTSDSLGMHIAISLKKKVVAFFGPTSASEIELFGLDTKIISKSSCYCCYKPDCKSDREYSLEEIFWATKGLLDSSLKATATIIVTAFKEPRLGETIKSILKQKIDYAYELLVVVPDKESIGLVKSYSKKYKQVKLFKDPGKGKSFALNLLFKKFNKKGGEILIFTDGDVTLGENSINEIMLAFRDSSVGCVSGRPVSSNSKNNKFGFWSHLLTDAGAHLIRKELDTQGEFFECSGYLFAFRNNGIVERIPLDVAEDAIIPYYFWKRGYMIRYVDNARVYVKYPENFDDWIKQRNRSAKAHESLTKYAPDFPKIKSFRNEASRVFQAIKYARTPKELKWTLELISARLYMWGNVFYETRFKGKHYHDAWERIESTKV